MKHLAWPILAFLLACSNPSTTKDDLRAPSDTTEKDVAEDVPGVGPDLATADVPDLRTVESDGLDEVFVPCAPGEGCFLDPCDTNDQCQSGFCVDHLGAGVCSVACQEDCPPGWACQPLGGGPDVVFVCISAMTNLCRPCSDANDCKAPGGAEDVCVDYEVEGSFCGGACTDDTDCPWGFSCREAVTVAGVTTSQCVADAGVCPCTEKSVTLGLWTPCEVSNDAGTCFGKRFCTDAGLSECDAASPVDETCNGLDDDCDGDVDEPDLKDGKLVELCDDANPCTNDLCGGDVGCTHEALSEVECVDGNSCTIADHCQDGVCVGTLVECDDENPCTDDSCDETGGCVFEPNAVKCDDGNPCTLADLCEEGVCSGVAVDCDCQFDSDCGALEDGNLCNGTLICDTGKLPYQCRVDPATVVACPEPEGIDSPCLTPACTPDTGECGFEPLADGIPCDDEDACTVGDTCVEGGCSGGIAANCADGNPCTDDSCDPDSGCLHEPGDGACDDGNSCTTGDHCEAGLCLPTALVDCDDDNPCTKDACNLAGGCDHTPISGPCSDGDACTINDMCQGGVCVPGKSPDCDDSNPCTDDSCGPDGTCLHVANQADCSDGNACTTGDHCANGLCVTTGGLSCDDGNICTTDACTPAGGCAYLLNTVPCDDADICTTGDHCHLGECIASGELACNDGNPCTDDACNPASGCTFVPNNSPCDDGEFCTIDDACSGGQCKGGKLMECNDDNPCTTDNCVLGEGCVALPNSLPCDDGNACTLDDHCADGACAGGAAPDCDDGNLCTDDSCDSELGCTNVPNSVPCSDSSACTVDDACAGGECVPGAPLDCDDAVACTVDACHPENGCVHGPDDGLCDDGNECTQDLCDAVDDCSHPPVEDDTPCGDGTWKCQAGECVDKQPCDGGWAYKGKCWFEGPVMSSDNCPTCDQICAGHGGCYEPLLVSEGKDQSCAMCKSTACPGCGCQDGPGNVAAHEAAPMHNGSTCEYTDHPSYPPICGYHYCNSTVWGRRRLCACNETP